MMIMKLGIKVFLIVLIGGIFFYGCSYEGSGNDDNQNLNSDLIRVLSFNIRYDNPNDGENRWEYRKDFISDIIKTQAHIVGTQEGMANQLEDLDKLLVSSSFHFNRVGVSRIGSEKEGEFCAIYYRNDHFELLDHNTFWLSENPSELGSVGWDAALPRIVTWAELYDNNNEQSFFVFNTHFDHRGSIARVNSSRILLEKIDEIAGENPVIVMGDLNTQEHEAPYKILTEVDRGPLNIELLDGFYHSEEGHEGPNSTWNGFNEIVPDHRIDFIFVNPKISVLKHRILTDKKDGRFPSDHLPVQAELKLK